MHAKKNLQGGGLLSQESDVHEYVWILGFLLVSSKPSLMQGPVASCKKTD